MGLEIQRSDKEIYQQLDRCREAVHSGESEYSCLTYEEGVIAAIEWVSGLIDIKPIEINI